MAIRDNNYVYYTSSPSGNNYFTDNKIIGAKPVSLTIASTVFTDFHVTRLSSKEPSIDKGFLDSEPCGGYNIPVSPTGLNNVVFTGDVISITAAIPNILGEGELKLTNLNGWSVINSVNPYIQKQFTLPVPNNEIIGPTTEVIVPHNLTINISGYTSAITVTVTYTWQGVSRSKTVTSSTTIRCDHNSFYKIFAKAAPGYVYGTNTTPLTGYITDDLTKNFVVSAKPNIRFDDLHPILPIDSGDLQPLPYDPIHIDPYH